MVPVRAPVTAHRMPLSARSSVTCSRRSGHHRRQLADRRHALYAQHFILRAAQFGDVRLLIPMLAHGHEVEQSLRWIAQAREQLVREAKAMAKVSHRNVVSVHEVDVELADHLVEVGAAVVVLRQRGLDRGEPKPRQAAATAPRTRLKRRDTRPVLMANGLQNKLPAAWPQQPLRNTRRQFLT